MRVWLALTSVVGVVAVGAAQRATPAPRLPDGAEFPWEDGQIVSHPIVTQIEFTDASRTKAAAAVTIGYSGATVVLEKVEGRWVALRLTDQWIT